MVAVMGVNGIKVHTVAGHPTAVGLLKTYSNCRYKILTSYIIE